MQLDTVIIAAIVGGGFAIVGSVLGIVLTARVGRATDTRRIRAEDERRWLSERRAAYASYLGAVSSMLQEIEQFAIFLHREPGQVLSDEDEAYVTDGLMEYFAKWEDVVQPRLGDVQLLASPRVADLADRASGALMVITAPVELREPFDDYYPGWFQAMDLHVILRNAMREELGLEPASELSWEERRVGDWPWLPDRPGRESYIQSKSADDSETPIDL